MSNLILGPRPKLKSIPSLNTDVIFTLLKPEEASPELIGIAARESGKQWVHFPLDAREHDSHLSSLKEWNQAAELLASFLSVGSIVYLHCAAGIHRTGTLAYLYFRHQGFSHAEAKEKVFELRPIIQEQIGNKLEIMNEMLIGSASTQ